MLSNFLKGFAIILAVVFISGCTMRTYVQEKGRVDQEMAGNGGCIQGTCPPVDRSNVSKTRDTYVLEIDNGPNTVEPAQSATTLSGTEETSSGDNSRGSSRNYNYGIVTEAPKPEVVEPSFVDYKIENMEKILKLNDNQGLQLIFGKYDQNLKLIEKELGIQIFRVQEGLRVVGSEEKIERVSGLMDYLLTFVENGQDVKRYDIIYALRMAEPGQGVDFKTLSKRNIPVAAKKGSVVTPKTKGQVEYVETIKHHDIVFGIGPAGTGKTYLAMAMAVNALQKGLVRRIILTRPAIEAGESLGFLPGDMVEKVSPYLRPLYDALYDMIEAERVEQYAEKGIIEVAPLAFMRGRTLNDAFVILDEAQNCTSDQMKMFLTRLGFDSKAVITGDITQSDLPSGEEPGLVSAERILKNVEGIKFVYLTGEDVVRHELVQRIIEAYEKSNSK
ncbi:MAG: PhoH family protein [Candidatus Omnitrophica bacterium]|nr:PhoH family protein [Candidatus Omnitrophota bacterium]